MLINKCFEYSLGISTTANIADQYVFEGDPDKNDKVRKFSVRASDGFQGCPQTGTPVMRERVQVNIQNIIHYYLN